MKCQCYWCKNETPVELLLGVKNRENARKYITFLLSISLSLPFSCYITHTFIQIWSPVNRYVSFHFICLNFPSHHPLLVSTSRSMYLWGKNRMTPQRLTIQPHTKTHTWNNNSIHICHRQQRKSDGIRAYRITQWHQNIYGILRYKYILLILRQSFVDVFIHFAFPTKREWAHMWLSVTIFKHMNFIECALAHVNFWLSASRSTVA